MIMKVKENIKKNKEGKNDDEGKNNAKMFKA